MDRKKIMSDRKLQNSGGWLLPQRVWLSLLACVMFVCAYTQRVCVSVAIVCMVNHTALIQVEPDTENSSNANHSLQCEPLSDDPTHGQDGPFVWSKNQQGHILGAFFYGYLVSQIPAGLLAQRFGGKWVLAVFFLLMTVSTLLTPLAATLHPGAFIAARVLVGIGSGAIFPTMHCMWSQWAPVYERSRLAGINYAGAMMGNVVAMPISGLLCEHGFGEGWPSVFYVFGLASAIWLVLWMCLVSDDPTTCRGISEEEKEYILRNREGQEHSRHNKLSTPWIAIATSPAVWAILVANFTGDWGLYTLLTNMPTYMREVLAFHIQENALYSALPFLGLWAAMTVCPMLADVIRAKHLLTTANTRKLFNTIGHVGAAVFLSALGFVDCSRPLLAVALLTCAVTVFACSYTGFLVNHLDIAPRYAGTLLGITNCLSATAGVIAPYVAATLTPHESRGEWQTVFFVSAAVYVFGALVYAIFAAGEVQSWARASQPVKCANLAKAEDHNMSSLQ